MQLEAVIFQKPSEERMDWKSDGSQKIANKAYPLPLDGFGSFSACSLPSKEASPAGRGLDLREEESPNFAALSADREIWNISPNHLFQSRGDERKSWER